MEDPDPAFNSEHDGDLDASPAQRQYAMNDLKDRSMEQLQSDGEMLEQLLHEDAGHKDRQHPAKVEAKPSTDLEQLSEHEVAGLSTKQSQQLLAKLAREQTHLKDLLKPQARAQHRNYKNAPSRDLPEGTQRRLVRPGALERHPAELESAHPFFPSDPPKGRWPFMGKPGVRVSKHAVQPTTKQDPLLAVKRQQVQNDEDELELEEAERIRQQQRAKEERALKNHYRKVKAKQEEARAAKHAQAMAQLEATRAQALAQVERDPEIKAMRSEVDKLQAQLAKRKQQARAAPQPAMLLGEQQNTQAQVHAQSQVRAKAKAQAKAQARAQALRAQAQGKARAQAKTQAKLAAEVQADLHSDQQTPVLSSPEAINSVEMETDRANPLEADVSSGGSESSAFDKLNAEAGSDLKMSNLEASPPSPPPPHTEDASAATWQIVEYSLLGTGGALLLGLCGTIAYCACKQPRDRPWGMPPKRQY
jgi:hypothetical protein